MGESVWKGADALRPFLVSIDALEPFPGNPRKGDVDQLRASLRRFGQVLPVLADPDLGEGDLLRIVARHHLVLAAQAEGWTHVAVIQNAFESEEEARAYLIADNRLSDLGGYDDQALADQLRALRELGTLDGTGYSDADADELLAQLRRITQPVPPGDGTKREHRDPGIKELVLNYSTAQLAQVEIWMAMIAKEKGTAGTSETVYAGLQIAARAVNG